MLQKLRCFAVVMLSLVSLQCAYAQKSKTARYDTVWIPITQQQIQQQVKANAHNAVALYQLWRRAGYQRKSRDFFFALEQFHKAQPRDGLLLSMRCAVVEESFLYGDVSVSARLKSEERASEVRRANLEAAKRMAPKLWLNPATEATLISWERGGGNKPEVITQQIQLCRQAVALAPDLSFPRKQLASYLSNLAFYTKSSDAEAIQTYKKAQQLSPANCAPSLGLIFHYRYVHPNSAERKKAEQAVLSTIPTGLKLTPPLKQLLVRNGIRVPR